jgi:hypothetical protein
MRNSKIHPVVSISWLEPAEDPSQDPYGRQTDINPPPVVEDIWQMDYIIKHRDNKRARKRQYLIKWPGWSGRDATWEPAEHIHPKDLTDYYMTRGIPQPPTERGDPLVRVE